MRRFFTLALVLSAFMMVETKAQSLVLEAQFETRFDNREYSSCSDINQGFTLFGMGFSPEVGVEWAERNRLMVGANLTHEFGDVKSLSEAALMVYYQFQTPQFRIDAGIFPRSKMIGGYSEAFFDDKTTFYHDPLQGLLATWQSTKNSSYAEFLIDWEGLRTQTQREKFRILAEARYDNSKLYAGGSLMVLHYAKTYAETEGEGVVDNTMFNPHIGVRLGGELKLDMRLGYLLAMQRDRRLEAGWESPMGGEFWANISYKGFALDNRLYLGDNLMPLYSTYGDELFEASTFYSTDEGFYNRTAVSYNNTFFNDTLSIGAELVFHFDGVGCGLQQMLKIGVALDKIFEFKAKR